MNDPAMRRASFPAFGGIGTAHALAKFYAMLACGGTMGGRRFLRESTVERMSRTVVQGPDLVLLTETAFSIGFMKDPVDRRRAQAADGLRPFAQRLRAARRRRQPRLCRSRAPPRLCVRDEPDGARRAAESQGAPAGGGGVRNSVTRTELIAGANAESVPRRLRPLSTPVTKNEKIFIAGHRGLAGGAILRELQAAGYANLLTRTRTELDLRGRAAVREFFSSERPSVVVVAAARVGGIKANYDFPVDFLLENLRLQNNLIEAAHDYGARKLLFLGSSCIYPKLAPQPIPESALLTGELEPTNEAVRHRQDRRHQALPGLRAPARRELHLRHADESLRPGRQLRPAKLARPARAPAQGARGEGRRRARGERLGQRHAAARVPARATISPTPAAFCWSTTIRPR